MVITMILALPLMVVQMAWNEDRARKLATAFRGAFGRRGLTMLRVSQDAVRHQPQVARQVECREGLGYTLASIEDEELLGELSVQLAKHFKIPRDYRVGHKLREIRAQKKHMVRADDAPTKGRVA